MGLVKCVYASLAVARRLVRGALHGAQHQRLHQAALKAALRFGKHARDGVRIARHEPLGADTREPAELLQHGKQRRQAIGRRLLVHAVQRRETALA